MAQETADRHTPNRGRSLNRLSVKKIEAWRRPGASIAGQKLSDGGGMYLAMTEAGTAKWRLKYRLSGAERTYTIGDLSVVGLDDARRARDAVKAVLRTGKDPVQLRRVERV